MASTWTTAATTYLRRTSPRWWPSPTSWRESAPSSCCHCVSWCASGALPAAYTHRGTLLMIYPSWNDPAPNSKSRRTELTGVKRMYIFIQHWCCWNGEFKGGVFGEIQTLNCTEIWEHLRILRAITNLKDNHWCHQRQLLPVRDTYAAVKWGEKNWTWCKEKKNSCRDRLDLELEPNSRMHQV